MNKYDNLKAFSDLAEMLAVFYVGLVRNGMTQDCAMDLTMEILHSTLTGGEI